jgi:hypothetical protein
VKSNPAPSDPDVFLQDVETDTFRQTSSDIFTDEDGVETDNFRQTTSNEFSNEIEVDDFRNPTIPEPAASAQVFGETFESDDFRQPTGVASPKSATNVMTADGTAKNSKSRNGGDAKSPSQESVKIDPRPNQLSDYASHTYNIALYMMQPAEYVKLMKAPKSVAQIPKQLIMRSGGVGLDGGDNFDIDFFIDNLQMTNLGISPNTRTTNTNAVDISFDITEPMGVTLIERLKAEAKNSLQEEENYIRTPYLLELTFKGYDDAGKEIVGAIKPKYIPIRLTALTFRIESTGTVYKVKAIPYHQDVFGALSSTIPINIQLVQVQ